jgi:hypothetical protein
MFSLSPDKLHLVCSKYSTPLLHTMKDIDLSVVLYMMESTSSLPTYEKKKECTAFRNLFLLLMVYATWWFPKLIGTPSVLDRGTPTVEVRRKQDTMFYLKKLNENSWELTPKNSNFTYEYK